MRRAQAWRPPKAGIVNRLRVALGLTLVAVAGAALYDGGVLLEPLFEMVDATALAAVEPAVPDPAPKPAWARDRVLAARAFGPALQGARADALLVMPTLSSGELEIHPGLLRAFDRSLATYAAAFLGQRAIAPNLASAAAREFGLTGPSDGSTQLDAAELDHLAARLPVTAVVVPVLGGDGVLELHVSGTDPGPIGDWGGFRMRVFDAEAERKDLARQLLTGPERLLRGLAARADGGVPRGVAAAPSPAVAEALEAASAAVWSGDPLEMRRGERRLAALALKHPLWTGPWVALATLRVLWAEVTAGSFEASVLRENATPARAIARLLTQPEGAEAARIDAIDHAVLTNAAREGELEALLARLAPGDPLRGVLAVLHPFRPRAAFGLQAVPSSTAYIDFLVVAGSAGGVDPQTEAVREWAESAGPEVSWIPRVALAFQDAASDSGDWSEIYASKVRAVPATAVLAWDLLRSACLDRAEQGHDPSACWSALEQGVRAYRAPEAPSVAAAVLADDEQWDTVLGEIVANLFDAETLERHRDALPDVPGMATPGFLNLWLLASELNDTANRVLGTADAATALASPLELVGSDARRRLTVAIDRVLAAAYEPAVRGARRRGQFDEGLPYMKALRPFSAYYPRAMQQRAWIGDARGWNGASYRLYDQLAAADPFDPGWLRAWYDYVHHWRDASHTERDGYGETESADLDRARERVARLVPRTWTVESLYLRIVAETESRAESESLLQASLERQLEPAFVGRRVKSLGASWGTAQERIALLERTRRALPLDFGLQSQLAALYRLTGQLEQARRLARGLRVVPSQHAAACSTLARAAGSDGNPHDAERIRVGCAADAPDKWKKARQLHEAAILANDLGAHERAWQYYVEAYEEIAGATYILNGMALTAHWLGNDTEAEKLLRRSIKAYPRSSSAYEYLARLQLRRGQLEEARATLREMQKHVAYSAGQDYVVADLYVREDDLDGLHRYMNSLPRWDGSQAFANAHAMALGTEAGLEVADWILEDSPRHHGSLRRRALYLVELGRFAEALPVLEDLYEWDRGDLDVRRALVKACVRTGNLDRAREIVDEYAAEYPKHRATYHLRSFIAEAEGDLDGALASMAHARSMTPSGADGLWDGSWRLQEILLREEELGAHRRDPARLERMLTDARAVANKLDWDPRSWELLARLLEAKGETREAQEIRRTVAAMAPSRGHADRFDVASRLRGRGSD